MQEKKILNFRPFVFTAVSIALGIVSGSLFYFGKIFFGALVCVLFLALTVLAVFFTGEEIKKKLYFGVAFILLFAIGLTCFVGKVNNYDKADLNGHYHTINGKITEIGQTDYGYKMVVDNVVIDQKTTSDYKVSLFVYGQTELDVGCVISFYGLVQDKSIVYEQNLSATDIERGIKYIVSINADEISLIGQDKNLFDRVHLFFRNTLRKGLGDREYSTAYGLLIGNTDEMDYDLITSYRQSGVAHIFAVSGLHIGFLATVLNFIFDKLKMNKTLKAVVITLILLFYSGVCGFSASSVRATIMSAILLISSIGGKRYDGLSSVGFACTIILLYSPLQLFCAGFQLSFMVVLGIILLSSPISKLLSFLPEKLASTFGVILSAWLVGIPVQLAVFGSFSVFSILANFILIPVVGVLYVVLFVCVLLGGLFGIPVVALYTPGLALKIINWVIGALDYKAFIVTGVIMGLFAIGYYLSLIFTTGLINMKKVSRVVTSVLCIAICLVGTVCLTANENNSAKAYVVGTQTDCATVIDYQEQTTMIVSSAGKIPSLGRYKRLKEKSGITDIDTIIFANGSTQDMQVYLTRICSVFSVESVCYFGAKNDMMEQIIHGSFGIQATAFEDGVVMRENIECKFMLNGYSVEFCVGETKAVVFSSFGNDYSGYSGLNGGYTLVVAVDYIEQIFSLYNAKNQLSYRDSQIFDSADSNGTACVYLN